MRKGIVRISSKLLMAGIEFPSHWEIESIHMEGDAYATTVISGPEFPEVLNGENPKQCEIRVHEEAVRFEVIPEEDT